MNTKESYESLLRKSINTAIFLNTLTLQEEPIIAICAENHSDTCIPVLASLFLGYRVNAYDCFLNETDLSTLIKKIPPSIMFVDEEFVEKIQKAKEISQKQFDLVVFGKYKMYPTFENFCRGKEYIETFEPVNLQRGEKTEVIMFSSGTTGLPKGICLSGKSLLKQGKNFL